MSLKVNDLCTIPRWGNGHWVIVSEDDVHFMVSQDKSPPEKIYKVHCFQVPPLIRLKRLRELEQHVLERAEKIGAPKIKPGKKK